MAENKKTVVFEGENGCHMSSHNVMRQVGVRKTRFILPNEIVE